MNARAWSELAALTAAMLYVATFAWVLGDSGALYPEPPTVVLDPIEVPAPVGECVAFDTIPRPDGSGFVELRDCPLRKP